MNHACRYVVIIGLMLCWLSTVADATSWTIELTNGREITATHAWEEGEELKFVTAHGIAGVSRALVKRVTSAAKRPTPESGIHHKAEQGSSPPAAAEGGVMQREEGAAQADREQKMVLTAELEDARKKYLAAMVTRNPGAEQDALEGMRAVYKRIYALADVVKAKHGGALPSWWND